MTAYSTGMSAYLCARLVDCKCCVLGVLFVLFYKSAEMFLSHFR